MEHNLYKNKDSNQATNNDHLQYIENLLNEHREKDYLAKVNSYYKMIVESGLPLSKALNMLDDIKFLLTTKALSKRGYKPNYHDRCLSLLGFCHFLSK